MQSLKEQIAQLESEKAQLSQAIAEHDERGSKKDTGRKNNNIYKQRFTQWKEEKERLEASMGELRGQIEKLTEERDALQAQSQAVTATEDQALSDQLQTLQQEKSSLETALADARVKAEQVDALVVQIAEQTTVLTAIREERDKLLSERESTSVTVAEPGSAPDLEAARAQWELEKADLAKALDAAKADAEAAKEQARKAMEEIQNIRSSNEKFQARIQDLQKARLADSQKATAQKEAAVAAAVEKAKGEMPASSSTSEDVASQHAEELRALEERLKAQFEGDLKAAVEAAKAEAVATAGSGQEGELSDTDREAAIAAAVKEHEEKLKETHAQEIAAAVERGRQEQAIKSKIKDSQLVRAQGKLKELEAQILEWKKCRASNETTSRSQGSNGPSDAGCHGGGSCCEPFWLQHGDCARS
ncbi:hypothetical protein OE88DRAFT_1368196 [Heliocybe sulcata]|uniref:Uncharacterized protein n=1 Tax=Heliocybe sulcata TaxID=5364 RepID=A0A5C3N364_9AGAM|nr:hypothetical protein OE88DRAFT_1368196 [Heliocybe sulcata]